MSIGMHTGDVGAASKISDSAALSSPNQRAGFWMALLGVVGLVGLVVPEIIVVAVALVWSMAGLFHFGQVMTIAVGVVVAVPSLWAIIWVVRAAINAEFGQSA